MTRDEIWVVSGASIFLLFGGFLFGAGGRNIWRGLSSSGWPKTAGVVVSTGTPTIYNAKISIKYKVSGKEYLTDTLHFGQTTGSGDSSDTELRRARYPLGTAVEVSYYPHDPSIAAVEPGFDNDALWLPGAGLAFLVPAIMFIALYLGISRSNRMFAVGLGIFAGIFVTLGSTLLSAGLVNLWRAHASMTWPQTDGVITYGVIDESNSIVTERSGDVFRAATSGGRLVYRYDVNGRKRYSNVRVFGQLAGVRSEWAAGIAALYPLGKVVSIAHSPDNPSLAVLQPGIDSEAFWLPGAGVAFLLFGLAVFIWGIPALTRAPELRPRVAKISNTPLP